MDGAIRATVHRAPFLQCQVWKVDSNLPTQTQATGHGGTGGGWGVGGGHHIGFGEHLADEAHSCQVPGGLLGRGSFHIFTIEVLYSFFLWLPLWNMEVPGPGVELELQLWPMPQPW